MLSPQIIDPVVLMITDEPELICLAGFLNFVHQSNHPDPSLEPCSIDVVMCTESRGVSLCVDISTGYLKEKIVSSAFPENS